MPFLLTFIWLCLRIPSVDPWTPAAHLQLREVAREYNVRHPGEPMGLPAPPWHVEPTTIERLTLDAQVVVLARLSKINSYLAASDDRILTDYAVLDMRVLSGHLTPTAARIPGATTPVTLVVWGGEAVVEGVTVVGTNSNAEAITDGETYLVFLRPARTPSEGQYEVLQPGIFKTSGNRAVPLLKDATRVFGFTEAPVGELLDRIQSAANRR